MKPICENCEHFEAVMDNYGDIEHICNLFEIEISDITIESCSHFDSYSKKEYYKFN